LEPLGPPKPAQLVASINSSITDAALVVYVRGRRSIRLVEVRPQVVTSPRTPVRVLDTQVRVVSPNGDSAMIGLKPTWPPPVNPLQLAPAAGTPLYPKDADRLAYEIVIGLEVSGGPAHIDGVVIDYEVDGVTRSVTFEQDITICIAEGGPTFGDTIWSKSRECPGNGRARTG
jgi:hypothetical protein